MRGGRTEAHVQNITERGYRDTRYIITTPYKYRWWDPRPYNANRFACFVLRVALPTTPLQETRATDGGDNNDELG